MRSLVATVGAEARLLGEDAPPAAYHDALETPPGSAVQRRIDEVRARSSAFLDHALA